MVSWFKPRTQRMRSRDRALRVRTQQDLAELSRRVGLVLELARTTERFVDRRGKGETAMISAHTIRQLLLEGEL